MNSYRVLVDSNNGSTLDTTHLPSKYTQRRFLRESRWCHFAGRKIVILPGSSQPVDWVVSLALPSRAFKELGIKALDNGSEVAPFQ
jgi:hypothetical protein